MNRKVFEKLQKYERIEAEIQRERAEALGRAGERLEQVLTELAELRGTIRALCQKLADAPPARNSLVQNVRILVQEHNGLRDKAVTYHRYLIIQREAVGLRDHRDVDRLYRIPDPLEKPRADRAS